MEAVGTMRDLRSLLGERNINDILGSYAGAVQVAARQAIASYLAAIDECAIQAEFESPRLARSIRECLEGIRVEEDRYADIQVNEANQAIQLEGLVEDQWTYVQKKTKCRYPLIRKAPAAWPPDPLQWPRFQLRLVLGQVLENTVQAMLDWTRTGQAAPAGLEVHINAERRGDNAWLYVWNNGPAFTDEDRYAINRGERPPHARARGIGFRLVRAILARTGGALWARNVAPPGFGALVTLRIPMVFQPAY